MCYNSAWLSLFLFKETTDTNKGVNFSCSIYLFFVNKYKCRSASSDEIEGWTEFKYTWNRATLVFIRFVIYVIFNLKKLEKDNLLILKRNLCIA